MDNICVAIRVRPLNQRESNSQQQQQQQQQQPWIFDDTQITQLSLNTGKPLCTYAFDFIYNSNIPTLSLYDGVAKNIVQSAMDGINGTIFAYGQTSSGKTFTMKGNEEIPGITPLSIRDIFSHIEKSPDREFLLRVSYLEIYNEVIQDLLNPEAKNLKIHEDLEKGIYVGGVKEEIVVSPEQVLALMKSGEDRRHIGATNMNEHSSRSHSIFRMVIESRERSKNGDRQSMDGAVKVSMLNLVDLAGSERISHTGAEGMRLKEGGHINKSLLALSTVIAKLSEGQRDSKLTRILQTALGGNARTAIVYICTVTPAAMHQEETLSTIKFATRAKNIKNKPVINEVVDQATMLRQYKDEIHTLKNQLAQREMLIEKKAEDTSAKDSEIHTLREQLGKLKGVIIHSSAPDVPVARPKRSSRRETWCPGEGGLALGVPGMGLRGSIGGENSGGRGNGDNDDLADELDYELGFSYRMPDLAFPSRKRQLPSDSPVPSFPEAMTDQPTPKIQRALFPEQSPLSKVLMLADSVKPEPAVNTVDSEVSDLRKEIQRLQAEHQGLRTMIDQSQNNFNVANIEKQALQQAAVQARSEQARMLQELEQMTVKSEATHRELAGAREEASILRIRVGELEQQAPGNWEEHKSLLEKALASSQHETNSLNEALSNMAVEMDSWKTKYNDVLTEYDLAQANWSEREEEFAVTEVEATKEKDSWKEKCMALEAQIAASSTNEAVEVYKARIAQYQEEYQQLHFDYERLCDDTEQEHAKLSALLTESELAKEDALSLLKSKEEDVERLTSLLEAEANRSRVISDEDKELDRLLAAFVVLEKERDDVLTQLKAAEERVASGVSEADQKHADLVCEMEQSKAAYEELKKECERLTQLSASAHVLTRERDQSLLTAIELRDQILALQQKLDCTVVYEANIQAESKRNAEAMQIQLLETRRENAALKEQFNKAKQDSAAQVSAYQSKCQHLETEVHNITAKLEHLQANEGSYLQRVKEAERESQRHLDTLNTLEGNASQSTKKVQQLQMSADLARQQCDSLSSKVAELTRENQRLEGKLADADRLSAEKINLMDAVSKSKSDLAQTNAAYERQREEIARLQQQLKRSEEALDQANHFADTHRMSEVAAEEKAAQAQAELQRLRRDIEEHEGAHRRDQVMHTTQLELKDSEIHRLTEELVHLQEELEAASILVGQLRKELAQLTNAAKDYDRVTAELSQLKVKYSAESGQWKEEAIKLKKELKATSTNNSSAEKERDTMVREMEKLKQKLEALDGKYKQTAQSNCALEADKAAADREIKQLRKQNADLERTNDKLKTTDNKTKETAAALASATKNYEAIAKTHETLAKSYDKLKFDFDAKLLELSKETEARFELEALVGQLQIDLEAKNQNILSLSSEKEEEIANRNALDQALQATIAKYDEATNRLAECEIKIQQLSNEFDDARKAKDQAEEEKDKLCQQLTEMHYAVEETRAEWSAKEFQHAQERDELATELNTVRDTLAQRESALSTFEHDVSTLKASLEEVSVSLGASTTQCMQITEQLQKTQEERSEWKQASEEKALELQVALEDLNLARDELPILRSAIEEKGRLLQLSREQVARSEEELQRARHSCKGEEQNNLQLRDDNTKLKWQLQNLTAEKANEIERLRDDARRSEITQEECQILQERVVELQGIIDKMDEEAKVREADKVDWAKMQGEIAALRGATGASSVSHSELQRIKDEYANYKDEAEARICGLEDEVEEYSTKLNSMVDDALAAEAIRSAQAKYQKKINELLQKLGKCEGETRAMKETCASQQSNLQQKDSEIERLKLQVFAQKESTEPESHEEFSRLVADLESTKLLAAAESSRASKAEDNLRKAKVELSILYDERKKPRASTNKAPLAECTNTASVYSPNNENVHM